MRVTDMRKIHKFGWDGVIADDRYLAQARGEHVGIMMDAIREQGYVPHLDLNPIWSVWYNPVEECFHFDLQVHAVYVGKRRAWEFEGVTDIDGRRLLPRTSGGSGSE